MPSKSSDINTNFDELTPGSSAARMERYKRRQSLKLDNNDDKITNHEPILNGIMMNGKKRRKTISNTDADYEHESPKVIIRDDDAPDVSVGNNDVHQKTASPLRQRKNSHSQNEPALPNGISNHVSASKKVEKEKKSPSPIKRSQTPKQPVVVDSTRISESHSKQPISFEPNEENPGTSHSMLISQAIRSGNDEKIRTMISEVDHETMINTIRGLEVPHVLPFLQTLTDIMRHGNIDEPVKWMLWLKALVFIHSTYLTTISDLDKQITPLLEWLHLRIRNLPRMLQLEGKMELIADSMKRRSMPLKCARIKPMITFEAGSLPTKTLSDSDDDSESHDEDDEKKTTKMDLKSSIKRPLNDEEYNEADMND